MNFSKCYKEAHPNSFMYCIVPLNGVSMYTLFLQLRVFVPDYMTSCEIVQQMRTSEDL